jgi:hypothetical protein
MTRTEWWRGAVSYWICPQSLTDNSADGIGDCPRSRYYRQLAFPQRSFGLLWQPMAPRPLR